MKAWQQPYEAERMSLSIKDDPVFTSRYLRPCNALAPDSVTICNFCQQIKGHPGQSSRQVTTCNRPAGHEGHHAFVILSRRGYDQLEAWT